MAARAKTNRKRRRALRMSAAATLTTTGMAVSISSLAALDIACTSSTRLEQPAQESSAAPPAAAPSLQSSALPTATAAAPAPKVPGPEAEKAAEDARARLRPYAVTNANAARATLYTWTTREQIDDLAKNKVLLTRSESPQYGPSYYDQIAEARAASGDKIAAILRSTAFVRARHAWPAPFATLFGWAGETYGEHLIRVTLKPDAWIAKIFTSKLPIEIVDLKDNPVAPEEVLKNPSRLAAVYFVNDANISAFQGTYMARQERAAYREYVLCNESMIAEWSFGTDDIQRELNAEADALAAFSHYLDTNDPPRDGAVGQWNARLAREVWPTAAIASAPELIYAASLAFPNEGYFPAGALLSRAAERIRALKLTTPSITHRPTAVFSGGAAKKPAPARPQNTGKNPKWRGTF